MILLNLVVAWLVVSAVLVILHRCGVSAHEHDHGVPGSECRGCLFCPTADTCLSAQPAPRTRTNQEDRS